MSTLTDEKVSLGPFGSLRLLKTEMIIANTNAAASLLIVFQQSIGMTLPQVALAQAAFTFVLLFGTIPTGWFADKFSRKWCNAFGDLIVGIGYVIYGHVASFGGVVGAEVMVGVGHAFSKGADDALQKGYSDETGISLVEIEKFIGIATPIAQVVMVVIGGLAGQTDFTYTFYVTAVPFFVGAILSVFMKESGERHKQKHRNPLRDIWAVTHSTVSDDRGLRWLLFAHALGFKLPMPFVLALGPLLLFAGAPLWWLPWAYGARFAFKSLGAWLGGDLLSRFSPWKQFAIPSAMLTLGLTILGFAFMDGELAVWTVITTMLVIGLGEGCFGVVTKPMVLTRAGADVRDQPDLSTDDPLTKKNIPATVGSVADTFSQAVYVLLLLLMSWLAGDEKYLVIVILLITVVITTSITTARMRQYLPDRL